jgi:hypothetical protein
VPKFKKGDRVTRSTKHPHRKSYNDLAGTIVEVFRNKGFPSRYKVKWDKKSGKYGIPDTGQQHSTLLAKYLTKVA